MKSDQGHRPGAIIAQRTTTILILTFCMLVSTGCHEQSSLGIRDISPDIFGEQIQAPDPAKANVNLNLIEPRVFPWKNEQINRPALSARASSVIAAARNLRNAGAYSTAITELEKAIPTEKNPSPLHRELAFTCWLNEDATKCREHLKTATDINKDDILCHYVAGKLSQAEQANTDAIRDFRTALLCTRNSDTLAVAALSRFELAQTLAEEGYLAAAITVYEQFKRSLTLYSGMSTPEKALENELLKAQTTVDEKIARAYEELGDFKAAAEYLQQAYTEKEISDNQRLVLAKYLARAGRYNEACDQARAALGTGKPAVDVLTAIYRAQGKPARLIRDLEGIYAEGEHADELTIALANALKNANRHARAVKTLQARLENNKEEIELRRTLFEVERDRRHWEKALDVSAAMIRTNPQWTPEAEKLARSLVDDERAYRKLLIKQDYPHVKDVDFATAYLLGILADAKESKKLASAWFDTSVDRNKTFIPARVELGKYYIEKYAWNVVIDIVAPEGVELKTDTRLECLLGQAYKGLDDFEKAISHFNKAIDLNNANTKAMYELADLYVSIRRSDQAIRQLKLLVDTDPLNERAYEQLFRSYLANGDYQTAGDTVKSLKRISASPTCIARCVAWLEFDPSQPDHEALRDKLHKAMEVHHQDAETLHLIAVSYLAEQRYADAARVFHQALKLDSSHKASAELLVGCLQRNLQFEEALELEKVLVSRYPNRQAWKGGVLDLLIDLQLYDEAIATIKSWLSNPKLDKTASNAFRSTLIQAYVLKKEYQPAIDLLLEWRNEEPQNGGLYRGLIEVYLQAGLFDRAMEMIENWYSAIPEGLITGSGEVLWEQLPPKYHNRIETVLLKAIEKNPGSATLQVRLIELLRVTDRFDEALDLAKNNISEANDKDLFEEEVFLTLSAADRIDEALTLTGLQILEAGRDRQKTLFTKSMLQAREAELLIRARQYRKALKKINRWLELSVNPEQKILYLRLLSFCQQEAGNLTEAREALSLAVELNPNDPGLCNDLGYTLADKGIDLEKAEKLIRVAVASSPRNGAYLDSFGWLLYKKGEFEQARKWLLLARNSPDGEDPVLCDHLADACWQLELKDEAKRYWAESVEIATKRAEQPEFRDLDKKTLEAVEAKLEAVKQGQEPKVAPVAE